MITFIQFINEVTGGGDFPSLPYWSAEKHGRVLEPEEKGSWLILHAVKIEDGKPVRTGHRRRTPVTNIASISEAGGESTAIKKGGG
jgi:hypothetical protein